jgi:hypothetical protein
MSNATIQYLLYQCPRALLSLTTTRGATALHFACSKRALVETIRCLVGRWPVSCLVVDSDSRTPLELARKARREARIVEFMAQATQHVARALMECVLSPMSIVPSLLVEQASRINTEMNEDTSTLQDFLRNTAVQALLKDECFQQLVCGIYQMNNSGRDYVRQDPGNKVKGVLVFDQVSENVECLFLHLRESPSLCEKELAIETSRP